MISLNTQMRLSHTLKALKQDPWAPMCRNGMGDAYSAPECRTWSEAARATIALRTEYANARVIQLTEAMVYKGH